MCGILGIFSPSGLRPMPEAFASALNRLNLRGPDDSGTWRDEHVQFGHRRLAVVDLSAAGHQPMESYDNRYAIVFNGEIYNHQDLRANLNPATPWRSTSDTETLIEAYRRWGIECLKRVNGMFAFAIWDKIERTLFIARDRMGVKPLYYAQRDGELAFASRPSALAALFEDDGIAVDTEALQTYLELGYVPAPLSFHRGTQKLPAAHYLLVNARGSRRVRYWDFRCIAPEQSWLSRSEEDLIDELQGLILNAVKIRLMSDVPLGAFLSGGVDSALVVAAMKSAGVDHPKTFTIGFKETRFNEGPAAAAAAKSLGVDHILENVDVDGLLELLPTYIDQYDEPFADASAFPTMAVARLARRHVTVALTGDGADELFGGYHYYPLMDRLLPLTRRSRIFKETMRRLLRSLPWHRARLLAGALQSDGPVELFNYLRSTSKHSPTLLKADLSRPESMSLERFEQFAAGFAIELGGAETAMRLDAGFTLPDLFLQKVDLATMAFSLEARCPMTDYRLVEWAMRLPLQFKLRDGQGKYLLKKALCRFLPAAQVYRPKMGFGVPIAEWLRGPLRDWAHALIYDEALMSRLPLEPQSVRELLRQQLNGERESHPLLWSVLMLLCFMQRHDRQRDLPAVGHRRVA